MAVIRFHQEYLHRPGKLPLRDRQMRDPHGSGRLLQETGEVMQQLHQNA